MKKKRRKIVTTVYLTPEQKKYLDVLCKITKVKQSTYIRKGIDLVLKSKRETK